ncbi:LysR family transcriptional regulator [Lacrimispora sp. 210928-DFI.3.58]|uniref:LysR family transcriptional regulator n=1 Tax=Lacrimispora sp. 210928-DFI.3.58 TaxID=2883214 RepID=UPI001D079617|nr:LysR family transcriptional regulator [Lacrimispora sp. 210928-DFI.3.58]MCB7317478.1 LysR family transcriptional regulator [Lacrimispora sp. 210928-DFI.3.58]
MEFKHIEYFVETCRHRSMSKAAKALYISQQALSRCIANMEYELGCTLFHRTVKGISLTEDGTYFYRIFSPQVAQFQTSLAEAIAHFENRPVSLPFCCAPLIFRCLDPELLFDFQEQYPHITLELLELSDTDCDAYVEADTSHFGLLAIPENRHGERLPYTPVKTFPLYLFVHKDNPLASQQEVNFSQLKDESFLMLDKKSYYRKLVRHYARKYHFTPKTAFESSDANQLISLVNKGRGIALSLEPMLDNTVYENVVMVPFDDATITWCIAFIYQDYEKLSTVAKKFMSFLIEQVNTAKK